MKINLKNSSFEIEDNYSDKIIKSDKIFNNDDDSFSIKGDNINKNLNSIFFEEKLQKLHKKRKRQSLLSYSSSVSITSPKLLKNKQISQKIQSILREETIRNNSIKYKTSMDLVNKNNGNINNNNDNKILFRGILMKIPINFITYKEFIKLEGNNIKKLKNSIQIEDKDNYFLIKNFYHEINMNIQIKNDKFNTHFEILTKIISEKNIKQMNYDWKIKKCHFDIFLWDLDSLIFEAINKVNEEETLSIKIIEYENKEICNELKNITYNICLLHFLTKKFEFKNILRVHDIYITVKNDIFTGINKNCLIIVMENCPISLKDIINVRKKQYKNWSKEHFIFMIKQLFETLKELHCYNILGL